MQVLSINPSRRRLSEDRLVREFDVQEKWSVLMHKLPKSRSPEFIQTMHQKGHVSADRLVHEYDIREKQGVNRMETPKVPKLKALKSRSPKTI